MNHQTCYVVMCGPQDYGDSASVISVSLSKEAAEREIERLKLAQEQRNQLSEKINELRKKCEQEYQSIPITPGLEYPKPPALLKVLNGLKNSNLSSEEVKLKKELNEKQRLGNAAAQKEYQENYIKNRDLFIKAYTEALVAAGFNPDDAWIYPTYDTFSIEEANLV